MSDTKKMECDVCDGCGWHEGGLAIKTFCEKCQGTGVSDFPHWADRLNAEFKENEATIESLMEQLTEKDKEIERMRPVVDSLRRANIEKLMMPRSCYEALIEYENSEPNIHDEVKK